MKKQYKIMGVILLSLFSSCFKPAIEEGIYTSDIKGKKFLPTNIKLYVNIWSYPKRMGVLIVIKRPFPMIPKI